MKLPIAFQFKLNLNLASSESIFFTRASLLQTIWFHLRFLVNSSLFTYDSTTIFTNNIFLQNLSRISRVHKRKGSTSRVTLILQCVTKCVTRVRDSKRAMLQVICVHVQLPGKRVYKLESTNNYSSLCKNILLINTL